MIDEDPFPPITSINITAADLRAVLNAKKDERFSPNVRIRNVWIPRQYLVYMDDLAGRRRVHATKEREKNGRYPYHSKQEIKKEKSSKGNNVFVKERHTFPGEKGHEQSFKEENGSKVCNPSSHLTWKKKWHVV